MTTPTAWAHLPNAAHIDRVLADLKAHPQAWDAARDAAWDGARVAIAALVAWDAARDAAWGGARVAAQDAAWDAARDAIAAWNAAWVAARDAIAALVAWDDCAFMLDMPPDAVEMLMMLGDDVTKHQAVLLWSACVALHHVTN